MAKMTKQVISYDDGSETVINYQDNDNAKEIEAEVEKAQIAVSDDTLTASPEVEEIFASAKEPIEVPADEITE